jgi:hypothetical protein
MESDAIKQIELDLTRTFPESKEFDVDTPEGQANLARLRRVLVAFSWRNQVIGYSQGLNFIVAVLLKELLDEEEAFWCFTTIVEDLLPIDYFDKSLSGCRTYQCVFHDLLGKKLPAVAQAFERIGMVAELYSTEWFITLFCRSLPHEVVLRIWDAFFYEGYKVLFRVALALLKTTETLLINAQDLPEALTAVQNPQLDASSIHRVLKVGFNGLGPFRRSEVDELRKKHMISIQTQLIERQKRLSQSC